METLHKNLKTVRLGVAAQTSRSTNPVIASYILNERDDLAKMKPAEIDYETLDKLCQEGYVEETRWRGFSNWILTLKGNTKLFELDGFDMASWRAKNSRYMCCDKAIPRNCVCLISTDCPEHGCNCHGTHD